LVTTDQFFEAVDRFGVPDFYSSAEIFENGDLSWTAEVSMLELGLMDVDPTRTTCSGGGPLLEYRVEEGSTLVFRVTTPTVVRVSRFVEIQSAIEGNVRLLDPGVYSIELAPDEMGKPLQVRFDEEVSRCD
jgi:hypothetical protein